jgi:monothiol glutaredoxin
MSEQTQPTLRDAIAEAIRDNQVILFMKGTPEMPACGFSARTVAALQSTGASFAAVDILPDPRIRQELSALSNWPTVPQLFVNGELVGGCDIVTEMYETASSRLRRPPPRRPVPPATRRSRWASRTASAEDGRFRGGGPPRRG